MVQIHFFLKDLSEQVCLMYVLYNEALIIFPLFIDSLHFTVVLGCIVKSSFIGW